MDIKIYRLTEIQSWPQKTTMSENVNFKSSSTNKDILMVFLFFCNKTLITNVQFQLLRMFCSFQIIHFLKSLQFSTSFCKKGISKS